MLLAKRLLGVVLVLAGLAAAVVGGWFTERIGTAGTATFALKPTSSAPILLEPTLLNRLTTETVVTITPQAGQELWVGTGALADTRAAMGSAELVHGVGVDVRDGRILTTTTGRGSAEGVTEADLWRRVERSSGAPIIWTVAQSQTPDSLLIIGERPPAEITVSWTHRSWFFQALVLTLFGVIIVAAGLLLLRSTWTRQRATVAPTDALEAPEAEVVR